ncbi:hypothetical protein BAUCODRAFT_264305 [Baudoinia panamericana UAMH 10762]|uniref:Acid phosphatase-like protein n=1 Tax=Baudoinia panamericana (strain UAMH 10762) TaxID=717646 RepID=M2LFQ2_BAUPA|nr:uncharacterized protein BAUCODRAFT_264305 [Baudoinia panamericana UAMH 10762]EMC92862.1 hypothetical protein BAUCODRAFT_264305 [Baudoinia panamericana UAMH 10762]
MAAGWGIFLVVLVIVVVLGAAGYILYAHYRARRLGLPPPSLNPFARNRRENSSYRAPTPAPSGVVGWVTDKFSALRNKRTAGGAYESSGYGGARGADRSHRGFGPLDPDEAWDARVDNEAGGYYEEQELGLQDPAHGPYAGGGYGEVGIGGIEEGRGRSRSRQRELDARYDEEVHGGAKQGGQGMLNPFGDHNEAPSLRSISPRPHVETDPRSSAGTHGRNNANLGAAGSADNSPTERRSMFREDV